MHPPKKRVIGIAVLALSLVLAVAASMLLRQQTELGSRLLSRLSFRPALWVAPLSLFALAAMPLVLQAARRPGERIAMAFGIAIALTLWWTLVMLIFDLVFPPYQTE